MLEWRAPREGQPDSASLPVSRLQGQEPGVGRKWWLCAQDMCQGDKRDSCPLPNAKPGEKEAGDTELGVGQTYLLDLAPQLSSCVTVDGLLNHSGPVPGVANFV